MIKHILFIVTLMFSLSLYGQEKNFFDLTDEFLSKNVTSGLVDYERVIADRSKLDELVNEISSMDLDAFSSNERKAALINVYNLLVIDQISKNYPTNSPLDISGFYDANRFDIAGNTWTLDHVENEVLRKEYMDARLHFVLVCGALGCPRISGQAYRSGTLEDQMDKACVKALDNGWFVYDNSEERKVYVSEIFDWFSDDFGGKGNVISWINLFKSEKFDANYKVTFYPYNWKLNSVGNRITSSTSQKVEESFDLQTFTGGSLLKKGQADITLFNTIYTQSKSNWAGTRFSGFRESFYTHSLQGTFGVSKSGRFNIGAEVNFKASGRSSDSTAASVTLPLDYTNTDSTRVGLSNVGLRLKFQPFKSEPNFSIQSTFSIPTVESGEGLSQQVSNEDNRYFLDWDRYVWWNQFFYSKSFSDFQIFSSVEALFRFGRNERQSSSVDLPAKVFFSYFPSNKITVYAMTEHVPRFRYNTNTTSESIADQNTHSGFYTASGAGFKYQFGDNLNIELLYTNFWRSRYAGLGNTFNIGIKYLIL